MTRDQTQMPSLRRLASLGLCTAVLAALAQGCGSSARHTDAGGKAGGPLYGEQAAASIANALLAAVALPGGTRPISEPPRAVAAKLARPINSQDSAKAVDRHAFWSSTASPEGTLSFLAKRSRAKVTDSSYGGTAGRSEYWSETLEAPVRSPLAGPRELFVSIVLDGSGRYFIRVDSVVAWHRPRPAQSLVPPVARWLEVIVRKPAFRALNPGEPSRAHTSSESFTTSAPATVAAVARAVNEMPVAEPAGPAPSCPAMFARAAPSFRLVFRGGAGGPDIATVRGRSGFVCERGGEASAQIVTPRLPGGLGLTDHLVLVEVGHGQGLVEHLEAAFHNALQLEPED